MRKTWGMKNDGWLKIINCYLYVMTENGDEDCEGQTMSD
jgi:hypothetical protein